MPREQITSAPPGRSPPAKPIRSGRIAPWRHYKDALSGAPRRLEPLPGRLRSTVRPHCRPVLATYLVSNAVSRCRSAPTGRSAVPWRRPLPGRVARARLRRPRGDLSTRRTLMPKGDAVAGGDGQNIADLLRLQFSRSGLWPRHSSPAPRLAHLWRPARGRPSVASALGGRDDSSGAPAALAGAGRRPDLGR